jgi:hypothetical protein
MRLVRFLFVRLRRGWLRSATEPAWARIVRERAGL